MQHRNWLISTYILLYFSCDLSAQLPTHHFIKVDGKKVIPAQIYANNNKTAIPQKSPRHLPSLPKSVPPLLHNQWDQYAPNNWMTPVIEDEHCVVGCIATAMSQIMHYWKYPDNGTGSITYDDSLGCKQILSADFSQSHYDWANMLDKYEVGKYSEIQGNAVALLSRDCGYSVQMKYTKDSSGAQPIKQALAMTNNFGYAESTMLYFRDFYTKDEITYMLKNELAEGRPILISAYNPNGGHAFVIDGYDERDWFHINLGNPESDGDCYTPLDCMSPDQPLWYDVDQPENGLNFLQIFTFTQPRSENTSNHAPQRLFAMQRMDVIDTLASKGQDFRICVRDLSNMAITQTTDSVALFLMKDGEIERTLYTYNREFLLEEVSDTSYTDTISINIPTNTSPGLYSIQPMYRDAGKWNEVRTCVGIPNYLFANISNENITISHDSANYAYITLEDHNLSDLIMNGSAPDVTIKLKAHNHEISGRLYVLMEPLDENGKEFYLFRQGFTLQKDEVSERRFHKTAIYVPATGRYRAHILYDNSLFADNLIELTDKNIEITFSHPGIFQIALNLSPVSE